MIKLRELILSDLFPEHMRTSHLKALSYACNQMIDVVLDCSEQTMLFSNVDNLQDSKLDLLAVMLHAPYYKTSFDIEMKRELVKNAVRYRNYAGKNISIQEILSLFYGEVHIEEWYQYDGEPFHFRLLSKEKVLTPEMVVECMKIIQLLKRVTAVYDGIQFEKDISMDEYAGVFLHVNDYITITQKEETDEV